MSLFLSALAVAISVGFFLFARSSFKKSHRIEKRQLEIIEKHEAERVLHQKNARLFAAFEKHPIQSVNLKRQALKDVLVIQNEGLCEARNVEVRLDDKPIMEHPAISKRSKEIKFINSNSSIIYDLDLNMRGGDRPRECEISWQDDSGIEGHYKTTLTV